MITRVMALLLALGVLLGNMPAFAASLARLTELKGDVQVLPKGGAWHAAQADEALEAGDAVKTGSQSSATLVRQDGTELELMPFAQIDIEDENGFLLSAGRAWSHFVKSMGLPFFIRTPNATALIRGTTLEVGFEEERSRVVVYEGLVEVQGHDGTHQDVAGGFRLDVDRTGHLERLERADTREINEGRLFRMRRGLEGRPPERGGPMPGQQDDRRVRGREGREAPRRERMDTPQSKDIQERLDRRLERVERRVEVGPEERQEARETKERPRRQEALNAIKRQLERTERLERLEDRRDEQLRDRSPEGTP